MSVSLREKILGASDIKRELVTVDAWDVVIEVRTPTGAQRAEAKKGAIETRRNEDGEEIQFLDDTKFSVALLIETAYEPGTENKVFSAADRDALSGKSASALDQVVAAVLKLGGVTVAEQKAMEKNSGATPSVASTSV